MKMGGDLAEFEKKRNTDHDFPPPYMWAENNKRGTAQVGTTPLGLENSKCTSEL